MLLRPDDHDPAAILEDAYVFAYPLVLLDLIREMVTNVDEPEADRAPLNQLFHARELATPKMTSLTRPNVDTLYSQTYLDLGAEPQLLYLPDTERFCSVQTFDGWSDTPIILGDGGLTGDGATTYALTGPKFQGTLPDDVVAVPMPTDLVWLLIRVRCAGPEDVADAHAAQDRIDLRPLSAHQRPWTPPRGVPDPASDFLAMERISELGAQEFFDRFNALVADNPPHPEDDEIVARCAQLGIGAGLTFDLAALPTAARERAATLPGLVDAAWSAANSRMSLHNGWFFMDPSVSDFGTDYAFRACVAHGGFANPVRLTTYPAFAVDESGALVTGGADYTLHFPADQLPPHHEQGWWSLTPYTSAGTLVENELERYVFGNGELPLNPDGSLDILLSATHPGPEREDNWLPIPAEEFTLVMRIYLPREAVIDHSWLPPRPQRH
ncbi:DUF1254 domain-containing protein [Nocardioides dubius]|uniref:DUF1254 domain-containing protein n=1 Tax=Nocardioides dubius TaxID=317019 RepID=A0ABP4EKE6_9ACTN